MKSRAGVGGPKTPKGKSRSAQNARRHGLNIPIDRLEECAPKREALARAIAGAEADAASLDAAREIAGAELDLERVRVEKYRLLNAGGECLDDASQKSRPKNARQLRIIREKLEILSARSCPLKNQGALVAKLQAEEALLLAQTLEVGDVSGIERQVDQLLINERYERRALSRRRKAVRRFATLSQGDQAIGPLHSPNPPRSSDENS